MFISPAHYVSQLLDASDGQNFGLLQHSVYLNEDFTVVGPCVFTSGMLYLAMSAYC